MALSQLQCLDDNHVNPRTNEAKPDFLYCEDQRLALEALLRDGREAFFKFLEARGLRGFLSDPELDALFAAAEPYDPGTELFPEDAEEGDPPLSLHYWPELSDTSVPEMDLGWPDSESYRGVTRATIYSQPPLEGQVHVKEIVRKMIAQAQKVIAVVMDVFTDVDIFRDLLDAGFKRRVSVYILLERTALPHFLSMCQRANMHAGHLKNLRVRCLEGVGFYTRSSTMVRGRMGHRFMFIDGDKAVSGSYSFTWMSSRLDRSLITVITGQAVETFDRLFRTLFATSTSVNLRQVTTEPEPQLDPVPQPVTVVVPSATVARKLYNPKYALALGNTSPSSSPTPSAGHNNTKKTESDNNSGNLEVKDTKKRGRRGAIKELIQEAPPLHPGLTNLEKACLISYLPTWPEPDPPSDVIGYINIRDTSKPPPVHLQRSEMFETSQAIRFSSPVSIPKQTLSDVAKPRQLTVKKEEVNKPIQDKTKAKELTQLDARSGDIKSKPKEPEKDSLGPELKSQSVKNSLDADKVHTDSSSSRDAGYSSTTPFSDRSSPLFSRKTSTPSPTAGLVAQTTQVVPTKDLRPDTLLTSDSAKGETSSNTQPESNSSQTSSPFGGNSDSNPEHQTQRQLPHTDSHTQAAPTKNLSEIAQHIQKPTIKNMRSPSPTTAMNHQPVGLTSLSEKVAPTANRTTITPLLSISNPLHLSSTTISANPPSSSPSSSSASTPPIPKPRTIQLFIEESIISEGQKKLDLNVLKRFQAAAATDAQKKPSEEENEILAGQQSKAGVSKDKESSEIFMEAPKPKQSRNSQEVKTREVDGLRDVKDGLKTVAGTNPDSLSDVLITDTTKAESVNIPVKNPQEGTKTLTSVDCKSETKPPNKVPKSFEYPEVPTENDKYVKQHKTFFLSTHNPQRILYSASTSRDADELVTSDSQKASTHTPVSATYNPHISKDTGGEHTQANLHSPAARRASNGQNTTNTHGNLPELNPKARASAHTPEKSLCLHPSDTNMKESFSPTAEREPRLLTPRARTPTPDSLTHTPDQKSFTTDFRTPTPDISDGYLSALSTTSEEFYECCESPLNDHVFDRAVFFNYSAKDDQVGFPCTSSPNASGVAPSPVCISYSATTKRNTSISDTKTLSRPASASSVSSLLEEKDKKRENEINEKIWREVDAISLKQSTSERGAEEDVKKVPRRVSEDEKSTVDHLKQTKDLTEVVKTAEAQPQGPSSRRPQSQSKAERLADGGRTLGELTTEKTEPKRSSTGDLRVKKAPSEGEKSDKEKAVDRAASGSSSLERKGKTQSAKEGQKPVPTAPRTPRAQQRDGGAASSSAQSKPPRPPVGPRPSGSRQAGSHSESKTPHGGHQDNTSPPHRPPSRPSPLSSPTPGRKHQADISHGHQSPVSRQPPASPSRAKGGQTLNQHSQVKSPASFFHNSAQQHSPPSKNQSVSPEEAGGQEEGKTGFGINFRMYNFKAIKDKMSKMPTQSKKGSSSPTAHARKSSS